MGGDPDVHGLLARVGGDDRVGGPEQRLAEPLRDQRLADAGQAQRPDHALQAHAPRGEPRLDLVRPHRPHLARRPGQRDDHAAIGPVDPPAGRGAVGVGEHRTRRQHPRLLEVGLGERLAATRPQAPQPLERRLIHDRLLATGLRDRLARQVVRRRTEAARRDDEVGTAECGAQRVHDRGEVVREVRDADDPHAQAHQRAGQLAAVGVGRLADRQLGADREQLGRDDRPGGVGRRLERGCIGHGASVLDGDATGRCYDQPRSPERLPTPAEDDRWIPNGPPLTTRGRPRSPARPDGPAQGDPCRGGPRRARPRRPREGRGQRDQGRGPAGTRPRRPRGGQRHLPRLPAADRPDAVHRGVAVRLARLGRPPGGGAADRRRGVRRARDRALERPHARVRDRRRRRHRRQHRAGHERPQHALPAARDPVPRDLRPGRRLVRLRGGDRGGDRRHRRPARAAPAMA